MERENSNGTEREGLNMGSSYNVFTVTLTLVFLFQEIFQTWNTLN